MSNLEKRIASLRSQIEDFRLSRNHVHQRFPEAIRGEIAQLVSEGQDEAKLAVGVRVDVRQISRWCRDASTSRSIPAPQIFSVKSESRMFAPKKFCIRFAFGGRFIEFSFAWCVGVVPRC